MTAEEVVRISARLAGIRKSMKEAGYGHEILHASPDGGLADFRERLRAERVDAVLIGGGVVGDSNLSEFKQQIIDVAHESAPEAKVLEFDHALSVRDLVRRAFPTS